MTACTDVLSQPGKEARQAGPALCLERRTQIGRPNDRTQISRISADFRPPFKKETIADPLLLHKIMGESPLGAIAYAIESADESCP